MAYLEVVFASRELAAANGDRDVMEAALERGLTGAALGHVTGGGSGSRAAIIEVELADERFEDGIRLVRKTLSDQGAPPSTVIKQSEPERRTWPVYGR